MNRLYAARYDGATDFNLAAAETFEDLVDVGIRWSLPGGVQRFEITVRAKSKVDSYIRYKDHLGHRFALFDNLVDKYIGGQCYEIVPDGNTIKYICGSWWKRANDDDYKVGDFPATGDTDAIIKDILTDSVSFDSTDQTNIDPSSVAIGGWVPEFPGVRPVDAIGELALVGAVVGGEDVPMDFYFVDPSFNGTQMQAPLPYLKSRSTTADPDWVFNIEDLAPGALTLARHIWDLKTDIYIGYGRLGGTHDGADGSSKLIDSTADFITDGVRPGDRVVNITDDTVFEVAAVTNLTTLTFTNDASASWDSAPAEDVYSIKLREPKWTAVNSPATSDWGTVLYKEVHMEMDQTQAEQYRDQLYTTYNDAVLQQSFVVSAPHINSGTGLGRALWRPLMGNSFYFRADDIFPEAALFDTSDDREKAFMAVAMDYTYRDNRLRVVPSTNDPRLDAILNQAGILNGQIISTSAGSLLGTLPGGGGFFVGGGGTIPGGGPVGSSGTTPSGFTWMA
jgi:hypothetical protein